MGILKSQALSRYSKQLSALLTKPPGPEIAGQVESALSLGPADEVRRTISLTFRRRKGMFFTGQALGELLVSSIPSRRFLCPDELIVDPACGAGDLILLAANRLPIQPHSLNKTLEEWGSKLSIHDIVPELVDITLLRLALLAVRRGAKPTKMTLPFLKELFPYATATNGMKAFYTLRRAGIVLLNPPFTSIVAPKSISWASGRVSQAALFLERVIRAVPLDTTLAAILPDVLRSGSRYQKWRSQIGNHFRRAEIRPYGLFDEHADIDVFMMCGSIGTPIVQTTWYSPHKSSTITIADRFHVHVGAVVPHRHPEEGPLCPFLHARNLNASICHTSHIHTRRFSGTTFKPPFVVVRRTSRPGDKLRADGILVVGPSRVAVENHLLVCLPKDGQRSTCNLLISSLKSPNAASWLDEVIRCRHLTVTALASCPLPSLLLAKAS